MSAGGPNPLPRQLTTDQRRQAEEDFQKINRLGQQYGLDGNQQKPPQKLAKQGMIATDSAQMPTLTSSMVQGSRYSKPFGQNLFQRSSRIIDIFDNDEYFHKDAKSISAEDFSVQQVFQFYLVQQKRYPTQAFLEMYVHDALQEYSKSRTEYHNLNLKVKKVAQLAQKLFNLTLLEETLNTRLKMGEIAQSPGLMMKQNQ